jgi:hypothetical protein
MPSLYWPFLSFPQVTEFHLESSHNFARFEFVSILDEAVCFRFAFDTLAGLGARGHSHGWNRWVSSGFKETRTNRAQQVWKTAAALHSFTWRAKPSIKQSWGTGTKLVSSRALRRCSTSLKLCFTWKSACVNRACFAAEPYKKHTFG